MVSAEQPEKTTSSMMLGAKLRHARLTQRLRMKDVATRAGCSEGLISKIENDKFVPSLALLHRLVAAIGINVAALFEDTPDSFITRAGERSVFARTAATAGSEAVGLEILTPIPNPTLFQSGIHIVPPNAQSDGSIVHEGEDFGYILEGQLELSVGDRTFHLNVGDAFYFPSTSPHSYKNPGSTTTRVLWFNTPPTF
jgi:transcriptional regulator with XRE-family HTH domain